MHTLLCCCALALLLFPSATADYFSKLHTRVPLAPKKCFNVSTPSRVDVLFGRLLKPAARPAHYAPLGPNDIIRFSDWPSEGEPRVDGTGPAAPATAPGGAYLRKPGVQTWEVTYEIVDNNGAKTYGRKNITGEIFDATWATLLVGYGEGADTTSSRWSPQYADWGTLRPWADGNIAYTPDEAAAMMRGPGAPHPPGAPPAPQPRPWQDAVLPEGVPDYFKKMWVDKTFGAGIPDDLSYLIQNAVLYQPAHYLRPWGASAFCATSVVTFAVDADALNAWGVAHIPVDDARFTNPRAFAAGALRYSRSDALLNMHATARGLATRYIGRRIRNGHTRPTPVEAGFLYSDTELGRNGTTGETRGGTWSYYPLAWDRETQSMQYALVEYDADVVFDMTGGSKSALGDASNAAEVLNVDAAFSPAAFAFGNTPWGNFSVAMFIVLDAITPRRYSASVTNNEVMAMSVDAAVAGGRLKLPDGQATLADWTAQLAEWNAAQPLVEGHRVDQNFTSLTVRDAYHIEIIPFEVLTASGLVALQPPAAALIESWGMEVTVLGNAPYHYFQYANPFADNVYTGGNEYYFQLNLPPDGRVCTPNGAGFSECLCIAARNLKFHAARGPPDALFTNVSDFLCDAQNNALYHPGRSGYMSLSGELIFVGEDYKDGTVIDLVVEALVHSIDHPSGAGQDPRAFRNHIYSSIDGGVVGILDTLSPDSVLWGSPLYYCKPHDVGSDILETIIDIFSLEAFMHLNLKGGYSQYAYEEYCAPYGTEALHAGSTSGALSGYIQGLLIPDIAYGVIQACGNPLGYTQCGTKLLTALLEPVEYAPAQPLVGCNTAAFIANTTVTKTTCCLGMAIAGILMALGPMFLTIGLPAELALAAVLIALELGIKAAVPGCDCEPVQIFEFKTAYRQDPSCVWDKYVLVQEDLSPVPLPYTACGLVDPTRSSNILDVCTCSSSDALGGALFGGAFCESGAYLGAFGVVDTKTGDAYCVAGTGPGPDGTSCTGFCGAIDAKAPLFLGFTAGYPRIPCNPGAPSPRNGTDLCVTWATPPPSGGVCSGHGECFTPGSEGVCVCAPHVEGRSCDRCSLGYWGWSAAPPIVYPRLHGWNDVSPGCARSCWVQLPYEDYYGSEDVVVSGGFMHVWDAAASTGIFNLTESCLPRAGGSPGSVVPGLPEDATLHEIVFRCGLTNLTDPMTWLETAWACPVTPMDAESRTLGSVCEFQPSLPTPLNRTDAYVFEKLMPSDVLPGCPSRGAGGWPMNVSTLFAAAFGPSDLRCDTTTLAHTAPVRPSTWNSAGFLMLPVCVTRGTPAAPAPPGTPKDCKYPHLGSTLSAADVANRWRACPAMCNPTVFYGPQMDTFGWAAYVTGARAGLVNSSLANGTWSAAALANIEAYVNGSKLTTHLTPSNWLGCFRPNTGSPWPWLGRWRDCLPDAFWAAEDLSDAGHLTAILAGPGANASSAAAAGAKIRAMLSSWNVSGATVLGCPAGLTTDVAARLPPGAHPCNETAWVEANPYKLNVTGVYAVPRKNAWVTRPVALPFINLGRVCGGPRRAALCPLTNVACIIQYWDQSFDTRDPASPHYMCADESGCICAEGSGLDPATNCVHCIRGWIFTDNYYTRCRAVTECISGINRTLMCGGEGQCVQSAISIANGSTYEATFNPVTDDIPLRLEEGYFNPVFACICAAGAGGSKCDLNISVCPMAPAGPAPPAPTGANQIAPVGCDSPAAALAIVARARGHNLCSGRGTCAVENGDVELNAGAPPVRMTLGCVCDPPFVGTNCESVNTSSASYVPGTVYTNKARAYCPPWIVWAPVAGPALLSDHGRCRITGTSGGDHTPEPGAVPADLAAMSTAAGLVPDWFAILLAGPSSSTLSGAYMYAACTPGWLPPYCAFPDKPYRRSVFGGFPDIMLTTPSGSSVMIQFPAIVHFNYTTPANGAWRPVVLKTIKRACDFTIYGHNEYATAVAAIACTGTDANDNAFQIVAGTVLAPADPLLALRETDGCTGSHQLAMNLLAGPNTAGCSGRGTCLPPTATLWGTTGSPPPAAKRVDLAVKCSCTPPASGPACATVDACAADTALAAKVCGAWVPTITVPASGCSGFGVCYLTTRETGGGSMISAGAAGPLPPQWVLGGSGQTSLNLSTVCVCAPGRYGPTCASSSPSDLSGAISYPVSGAPALSAWCVAGWLAEPPLWAYVGCFSLLRARAYGDVTFRKDPPSVWVEPDAWPEFSGHLSGAPFVGIAVRVAWVGNVGRVSLMYGDATPVNTTVCSVKEGIESCWVVLEDTVDPRRPLSYATVVTEGRYSEVRYTPTCVPADWVWNHATFYYDYHEKVCRQAPPDTAFHGVLRVARLTAWGGDTGLPIAPDFRGELAGGALCRNCVVTAAPGNTKNIGLTMVGDFPTLTKRDLGVTSHIGDSGVMSVDTAIHIECDSCADGTNQTKPVPPITTWNGTWRGRDAHSPYTAGYTIANTGPTAADVFPMVSYGCSDVELAPFPVASPPPGGGACTGAGGTCGLEGVPVGGKLRVAFGTPTHLQLRCGADAATVAAGSFDGTCRTAVSFCEPVPVALTMAPAHTPATFKLGGYADVTLLNFSTTAPRATMPIAPITLGACTGGSGRCRLSLVGPCNASVRASVLKNDLAMGGGDPDVWVCPFHDGSNRSVACNARVPSGAACVKLVVAAGFRVDTCAPGLSPSAGIEDACGVTVGETVTFVAGASYAALRIACDCVPPRSGTQCESATSDCDPVELLSDAAFVLSVPSDVNRVFGYFAEGTTQDGEISGDPGVCSGHGLCALGASLPSVLYHGVTKPVDYRCTCAPGWVGLNCGARDGNASLLLATCLAYIPPEQRRPCAVNDLVIPVGYRVAPASVPVNSSGATGAAACVALGGRLVNTATFRSLYIGARGVYARWMSGAPGIAVGTSALQHLCIDAINSANGTVARYIAPRAGVLVLARPNSCKTIGPPICLRNTCAHNDTVPLVVTWFT